MNHPPFFIVGTGRCGTQMLRNMLMTNERIVVLPETNFIPTMYDMFGVAEVTFENFVSVLDEIYGAKGKKWLVVILEAAGKPYEGFVEQFRKFCDALGSKPATLKGFLEAFFSYLYPHVTWYGDKSPHYGVSARKIRNLWPEAKFIHLTRDGIDVAQSMCGHEAFVKSINGKVAVEDLDRIYYKGEIVKFSDAPVKLEEALEFWQRVVLATMRELERLPNDSVLTVRYEDLVFHPKREIFRIANFLGFDARESWVARAMAIPRPFPEKHQVGKFSASEYRTYSDLVKEGMAACGYPYDPALERDFFGTLSEMYRGRSHYVAKIKPRRIAKKILNALQG